MSARENAGFTLIELIAVLVVVSVLSIIIANRVMDTDSELIAQNDVIKTHLRYAQTRAMGSNVKWGIDFKGSTYSLFKNANTSDTVTLPGEDSKTLNLPSGVSANVTIFFDSWGKPYSDALGQIPHPSGQIGGLSINITADTGFVE